PSTASPTPPAGNTSGKSASRRPPGTTAPGPTCRCPPTARQCALMPTITHTTRWATSRPSTMSPPTAAGPAATPMTNPITRPPPTRLTSTRVGSAPDSYTYDAHGNITAMPHLTLMEWNWKDQLHATSLQPFTTGPPRTTYYRYDAAGQRARKVTDDQNARL